MNRILFLPLVITATLSAFSQQERLLNVQVGQMAPEIVMAIGLQIWFIEVGGPLRTGMIPLWIAVSVFSTALTALLVRSRILAMDPSLEAAASDLYATPPVTLRKVIVPIAMPAMVTAVHTADWVSWKPNRVAR